jgi:hypothetical protein
MIIVKDVNIRTMTKDDVDYHHIHTGAIIPNEIDDYHKSLIYAEEERIAI